MRQRTVSWIRSASRARVACQWKAKPRMSTTKPVVAESVTVSAVVERQFASAALRGCMTASMPIGLRRARTVANAVRAVGQHDFHGAGDGAERGQRLRRAEHVEDVAALVGSWVAGSLGTLAMMVPSTSATRTLRPAPRGPSRQRVLERVGGARQHRLAVAPGAIERCGEMIGQRLDGADGIENDLAAMFEHLHRGADADRQHEGDDQNRNGAPQQRLGGQKPPVGRLGDRLRQPFDRIRT